MTTSLPDEFIVPDSVTITEVGPRDGLQSFERGLSADDKVKMINILQDAGHKSIEVTAFARPEVIPHLADAEEVLDRIDRHDDVDYRVLVPNLRGAERAIKTEIDTLVPLITVTESYCLKNQNRPTQEVLNSVIDVLHLGKERDINVDVAIATTFFDPYEGDTPIERVEWAVAQLMDAGMKRAYVASSVGMANPKGVYDLCRRLLNQWPDLELGFHIHDTNGMGLATALAAMQAGVRRFEGSVCGIGGGIVMPHGMTVGNIPTEDIVYLFHEMGVDTGLDPDKIVEAAKKIAPILGLDAPRSHSGTGGRKKDVRAMADASPREHPV